jgi:hypothetical protein
MNNKQSSSVEWFAQESWKLRIELEGGKISIGEYANKYYQLKEQAKEMHEKETINFAQTWAAPSVNKEHLEYFYNETFKKQ